MKHELMGANGSIQDIDGIPDDLKELYKTVWEMSMKDIIDMARHRGFFIDQSQSLNLFMEGATMSKLTSMHFYAWKSGLKTGMYYLRTKSAVDAIKFTLKKKEAKPSAPSAADLLSSLEEDDDEDFEEDDGLTAVETDETDVVFGTGKITPASMMSFIRQYPDSTLKYLLRRNLDGRPLPTEYDQIYKTWEERGLMRGRVRRYVLQIMDWEDVPDLPVHELLGQMRNRLMDMKLEAEQA